MYSLSESSPSSSLNVTPSSSPSSSPIFGPVDSSPPSSPGPFSLDSPPRPSSATFSHPFAASTKAIKRPPSYEKKPDSPPCTPPGTFARALGMGRRVAASRTDSGSEFSSSSSHPTIEEERIWADALRDTIDRGIGHIDLSNKKLKFLPPSVGDLAGFFNTTELSQQRLLTGHLLARDRTESALDTSKARSFAREQSIKNFGKERHVVMLYLMGNEITLLPPELFSVKNITVLSLRANKLAFIPPDICLLTNLEELNISNNKLRFLPWQMRDMNIKKLWVYPNPFLQEPSPSLDKPRASFRPRRSIARLHSLHLPGPTKPVLSPVTLVSRVTPLAELCYRLLLAPVHVQSSQTVLATYYGLPLSDQWSIPPSVRRVFMDAVPGIIRPRKRFSNVLSREDLCWSAGMGKCACPNPAHPGRVFVRHGSERFSWERRVAGVEVGGTVPLQWRGCLGSCLDFLDEEAEGKKQNDKVRRDETEPTVDIDVDMALAVQPVDLGSGGLDMDDFEE